MLYLGGYSTSGQLGADINWNNNLGLSQITNPHTMQFTIEFWFNIPTNVTYCIWLRLSQYWNSLGDISMSINNEGKITIGNNSDWFSNSSPNLNPQPITKGEWHHFALVNNLTNRKIFIDGKLMADQTDTSTSSMQIKYILVRTNSNSTNIPIDEALFCLEAKYSTEFTPPQAPYYIQSST